MSLSTLLEAAQYLDYLHSSQEQQQQQHQPQQHQQQLQQQQQQQLQQQSQHETMQLDANMQPPESNKRSNRRQRLSKKSAANTMVAMSLPATTSPLHMQSVPIPVAGDSSGHAQHAASLSSSFTTGSPLSSFASTALLCSKASGVTSASSSVGSPSSASDSSSSCGEIMMGDNDFNPPQTKARQSLSSGSQSGAKRNKRHHAQRKTVAGNTSHHHNHHDYHITHQKVDTNRYDAKHQPSMALAVKDSGNSRYNHNNHHHQSLTDGHSVARYIAATSAGPQLVTMTATSSSKDHSSNLVGVSASAPIDGSLRAGHVIHAANGAIFNSNGVGASSGTPTAAFSPRFFTGKAPSESTSSFGSDINLSLASGSAPSSCPPFIMARVQPMILNSVSPSTQGYLAFQPANAASPTSSSSSYSRHRELHKTLEKNRRAHLRHCFELLKAELPPPESADKKTSHINIIKSAIRYILALKQQECEIDNEIMRLTKVKNELTAGLTRARINDSSSSSASLAADTSAASSSSSSSDSVAATSEAKLQPHQPASEQQLSLLLSQSKID